MEQTVGKSERLFSLDVLRGLDMLLLCVIAPMICEAGASFGFADHPLLRQFDHNWGGFTLYDLIMPLFIFMCGAAVPFALRKRLDADGRTTRSYWGHVLRRVVLLWVLGMVAQGNLLTFDPLRIHPYCNTLQTIAAGYLIAAAVMPLRRWRVRVAITVSLIAAYTLCMAFGGDYSKEGNFAHLVDKAVLGAILPAGSKCYPPGAYAWWFPTLMFGFVTLVGMHSTEILTAKWGQWAKAKALLALGAGLLVGGLAAEWCGIPCNKMIMTTSFTLQATGWSVLLLDSLYVVTDIFRLRRGWWLAILYGQASLAAYVIGDIFPQVPRYAAQILTEGVPRLFGEACMPFVRMTVACALVTFALWLWTRARARKAR